MKRKWKLSNTQEVLLLPLSKHTFLSVSKNQSVVGKMMIRAPEMETHRALSSSDQIRDRRNLCRKLQLTPARHATASSSQWVWVSDPHCKLLDQAAAATE
jgi:hypothetical protein